MAYQPVEVVVFDLGGVLVELGDLPAAVGVPADDFWQQWLRCPWVRRYERGLCTSAEFAAGFVGAWPCELTPSDFLDAFRAWPTGPFPGAAELVAGVGVRTACLSNGNDLHWARFRSWGLAQQFDETFMSFELGLVKPDAEIFEHVVDALGVPAGRVLFLDDNLVNVEAGRAAGMQADRVAGVAEARQALVERGVLPEDQ